MIKVWCREFMDFDMKQRFVYYWVYIGGINWRTRYQKCHIKVRINKRINPRRFFIYSRFTASFKEGEDMNSLKYLIQYRTYSFDYSREKLKKKILENLDEQEELKEPSIIRVTMESLLKAL